MLIVSNGWQFFHGFANFLRTFITDLANVSETAAPPHSTLMINPVSVHLVRNALRFFRYVKALQENERDACRGSQQRQPDGRGDVVGSVVPV